MKALWLVCLPLLYLSSHALTAPSPELAGMPAAGDCNCTISFGATIKDWTNPNVSNAQYIFLDIELVQESEGQCDGTANCEEDAESCEWKYKFIVEWPSWLSEEGTEITSLCPTGNTVNVTNTFPPVDSTIGVAEFTGEQWSTNDVDTHTTLCNQFRIACLRIGCSHSGTTLADFQIKVHCNQCEDKTSG